MRAKSSFLLRFVRPSLCGEIVVTETSVRIRVGRQAIEIPFPQLGCVSEKRGWLWSTLTFPNREQPPHELPIGGITKRQARVLRTTVFEQQASHLIAQAKAGLERLCPQDHYLNWQAWADWRASHERALAYILSDVQDLPLAPALRDTIAELLPWTNNAEEIREARNQKFVEAEVARHKELFDTLESYPLTPRQREAIVCDEDNSLIVAGAGTGKTSTVVGKVAYVLRKGLASALSHPKCRIEPL